MNSRPYTTAILAMTADGKIADYRGTAARFGSINDRTHLERQVSLADGVLFGAGTLRAYGTTMSVSHPTSIKERSSRSQPPQPVQIVVSASANLDPQWRFFQQPVPRWLITTEQNRERWQSSEQFERIITATNKDRAIDLKNTLTQLKELGLHRLAVLGGGETVASLMQWDAIDELWLTICPLILGGNSAPTPVGGLGFIQSEAKKLQLLEVQQKEGELFLHYRVKRG